MPPARRPLIAVIGLLGFGFATVSVWLGAEGIFRLARVGPPALPGTPGAGAQWLAYAALLGGVVLSLLAAAGCLRLARRLGGGAPPA